jgi:tetratricopeptide (TPR) repeat protein
MPSGFRLRGPLQIRRLRRAQTAAVVGDLEKALRLARRAAARHPDDPFAQLLYSRLLCARRRRAEAGLAELVPEIVDRVGKAVATSPSDARILTMAAYMTSLLVDGGVGDDALYALARDYTERASEAASRVNDFPYGTTVARLKARFAEAEGHFDDAEHWYARALTEQATARKRRVNYKNTLVDSTSLFFLAETAPGVVVDYARLLTNAGRHADALAIAQQGVADNPGDETLIALRERCEEASSAESGHDS